MRVQQPLPSAPSLKPGHSHEYPIGTLSHWPHNRPSFPSPLPSPPLYHTLSSHHFQGHGDFRRSGCGRGGGRASRSSGGSQQTTGGATLHYTTHLNTPHSPDLAWLAQSTIINYPYPYPCINTALSEPLPTLTLASLPCSTLTLPYLNLTLTMPYLNPTLLALPYPPCPSQTSCKGYDGSERISMPYPNPTLP